MSRFDSDLDAHDWARGPYVKPNAVCSECGDEFVKGRDDDGPLCDRCCVVRDARVRQERSTKTPAA